MMERQIRELVFLVQNGLMSVDEARTRLGMEPKNRRETALLIPWNLLSAKVLKEMLDL